MMPRDLCGVIPSDSMCMINIGRGWGYGISKGQEGRGGYIFRNSVVVRRLLYPKYIKGR